MVLEDAAYYIKAYVNTERNKIVKIFRNGNSERMNKYNIYDVQSITCKRNVLNIWVILHADIEGWWNLRSGTDIKENDAIFMIYN